MTADQALFRAIDRKDLESVLAAIANGANLDARRRCNTPLLDAVFSKNEAIIKALVRAGAAMEGLNGTRDPLNESFNQGDMPTVAALLGSEPTYQDLALAVDQETRAGVLGSMWTMRNLLRPIWLPLLEALGDLGTIARYNRRWWLAACQVYGTGDASVAVLEARAPLGQDARDLLPALAKEGQSLAVFKAFARAGLLDDGAMFKNPGTTKAPRDGVLASAMQQQYKPIPLLKWLARHAASLPNGKDRIKEQIDTYATLSVGMHASMPLARIVGKSAGMDPIAVAAQARMPDGTTALHLLMHRNIEHRRCMELAHALLAQGADPMALKTSGEPACYRAAFKGDQTPQAIRLFDQYGVDWSEGGVLWTRIARDPDAHIRWIEEAMGHIHLLTVEKQHEALQERTPASNSQGLTRRI